VQAGSISAPLLALCRLAALQPSAPQAVGGPMATGQAGSISAPPLAPGRLAASLLLCWRCAGWQHLCSSAGTVQAGSISAPLLALCRLAAPQPSAPQAVGGPMAAPNSRWAAPGRSLWPADGPRPLSAAGGRLLAALHGRRTTLGRSPQPADGPRPLSAAGGQPQAALHGRQMTLQLLQPPGFSRLMLENASGNCFYS